MKQQVEPQVKSQEQIKINHENVVDKGNKKKENKKRLGRSNTSKDELRPKESGQEQNRNYD